MKPGDVLYGKKWRLVYFVSYAKSLKPIGWQQYLIVRPVGSARPSKEKMRNLWARCNWREPWSCPCQSLFWPGAETGSLLWLCPRCPGESSSGPESSTTGETVTEGATVAQSWQAPGSRISTRNAGILSAKCWPPFWWLMNTLSKVKKTNVEWFRKDLQRTNFWLDKTPFGIRNLINVRQSNTTSRCFDCKMDQQGQNEHINKSSLENEKGAKFKRHSFEARRNLRNGRKT